MKQVRRLGVVKRQQATSTLMGTLFVRALEQGEMLDRSGNKQTGGKRKRAVVPVGLAKFFRKVGE